MLRKIKNDDVFVDFVFLTGKYKGLEYEMKVRHVGKQQKIKFNDYYSMDISKVKSFYELTETTIDNNDSDLTYIDNIRWSDSISLQTLEQQLTIKK